MALYRYKTLLLIIFVSLALIVAGPALEQLIVYPKTEPLTEFWLYGPNHDATYPSNVTVNQAMRLYVCGANHLGEAAYYQIEVKFRNLTQSGPDSFNHTASTLKPLTTLTSSVVDNGTFEIPIDISFQYEINPKNTAQLNMQSVTINGDTLPINQTKIKWDSEKAGFFGNLVFELWHYNPTSNAFEYHERYIGLWLRMDFSYS